MRDSSPHSASDPLDVGGHRTKNPLSGVSLFTDGPRYGVVAKAIAGLVGADYASFPTDYSWSDFHSDLATGRYARRLRRNHHLAREVSALGKIASEPEPERLSPSAMGGGPGALAAETNKIFCSVMAADPGATPVIVTYFAHPLTRDPCLSGHISAGTFRRITPTFHRYVREIASATGNHPVVFMAEMDAVGSSGCYAHSGTLRLWEGLLRYEIDTFAKLPHAVVYLEAGYSNSNDPRYTASVLNGVGIGRIRGFFTNDTHNVWTISEGRWAEKVSSLTHGAHFVINTAQNGNGQLIPHDRVRDGNEVLCNPPGRALGPRPTTRTNFPHADGYEWLVNPGISGGDCNGGPAGGTYWVARGVYMAEHANERLGPHSASRPY